MGFRTTSHPYIPNAASAIKARSLIREKYPDIMISVSHEVDPAFREFERTLVTSFDAFVKPVVDRYLERIERWIKMTRKESSGLKSGLKAVAFASAAIGVVLASTVAHADKSNDTLNAALSAEIATLDYYMGSGRNNLIMSHHIYDTLLYKDHSTGKIIPALATNYKYLDDTTIEFTLFRQDIEVVGRKSFNLLPGSGPRQITHVMERRWPPGSYQCTVVVKDGMKAELQFFVKPPITDSAGKDANTDSDPAPESTPESGADADAE